MRRQLLSMGVLLGCAVAAFAQSRDPQADEPEVIFDEIVQVAAAGKAVDVAFANHDLEIVQPTKVVWIADPTQDGVEARASQPIPGTAKAGTHMGRRGPHVLQNTAAVTASSKGIFALSESGRLTMVGGQSVDSLHVGRTLATAIDVDVSANGLIFVLWGSRVEVFTTPLRAPLWSFELDDDMKPAVALAASAAGEVFVVGHGSRAVNVYELTSNGRYERKASVDAGSLELEAPGGVAVTPFMLLPVPEREGWSDRDRFVLVSDTASGSLIALNRKDLSFVGRWDLRQKNPGAAPGRLAVSNRGQIAYVDQRAAEAWVLPTSVMAGLLSGADFRWRILNPEAPTAPMRVQGGDTLRLR